MFEPREESGDDDQLEEEDEEEEEERSSTQSRRRRKRQAPYIIFPEILCIVDYDGYRFVRSFGRRRLWPTTILNGT